MALPPFGWLSEFERDILRGRTRAELKSDRRRGRLSGRPKGLSLKAQGKAAVAEMLYREGKLNANKIAKELGMGKGTL